MSAPLDRLQQLEAIEREIATSLQHAGQAVYELSRDKPSLKNIESHTNQFLKTLEAIENGLSKHINYLTQVSTSQPHEGSSYSAQKDLQMAFHRMEHVRSRLSELEKMKNEHTKLRQPALPRTILSTDSSFQRSFSQPDPTQGMQRAFSQTDPGSLGLQRSFSHSESH